MASPKPDRIRARAIELGRKMGARGVAAALAKEGYGTIGKSAVAEWLRADRAKRAGAPTPKPKAKRDAKREAPAEDVDDAGQGDTGEADADAEAEKALANVDPEALDFAELVNVDAQVSRFMREAFSDRDERRYGVLVRLKLEVRTALEKMRPRPKVDPAADPASLASRRDVLARLTKMIENSKAVAAQRTAGGQGT